MLKFFWFFLSTATQVKVKAAQEITLLSSNWSKDQSYDIQDHNLRPKYKSYVENIGIFRDQKENNSYNIVTKKSKN